VYVTFSARSAVAKPLVNQLLFLACLIGHFLYFEEIYNLFRCHLTLKYIFSVDNFNKIWVDFAMFCQFVKKSVEILKLLQWTAIM